MMIFLEFHFPEGYVAIHVVYLFLDVCYFNKYIFIPLGMKKEHSRHNSAFLCQCSSLSWCRFINSSVDKTLTQSFTIVYRHRQTLYSFSWNNLLRLQKSYFSRRQRVDFTLWGYEI